MDIPSIARKKQTIERNRIMKKELQFITIGLSFAVIGLVSAADEEPINVEITRAVVINGTANASSIGVAPSTITLGVTGADKVNAIGVAMQYQFLDSSGNPVNITNFQVTSATYTLVHNGIIIPNWTNVTHGAYNPIGDSSVPDLIAYNSAGTKVSTDGQQVVGTIIPTMSKFQILDQQITLGAARPKLMVAGDYYRLDRKWSFSYVYGGQSYTHVITPLQSYVKVLVLPDLPGFDQLEALGPFQIRLMASVDLVNWVPTNIEIPDPRPTDSQTIIALATIPGLAMNGKLFLRYQQP